MIDLNNYIMNTQLIEDYMNADIRIFYGMLDQAVALCYTP